jgi:uncharacterized repeat protein (TIGR02543 family)
MKIFFFRKRILIIPCVFIAALLIGGEIYSYMADVSLARDATPPTTSDTSAASASKAAKDSSKTKERHNARVTFYAGDASVARASIKPDKRGGYTGLPRASKDGYEFIGWFTERTGGRRVSATNHADVRSGDTLYARWRKKSRDVDKSVSGLPVLMYHWFYDTDKGDEKPATLKNNWMEASQFKEEMTFLKKANWYFPTWDEVHAYVKGEIDLPDKSIVITVDDGRKSFYEYAIPIFERLGVRGTGFIIANKLTAEQAQRYRSRFVSLQSHTWNMHDGHGNKSLIQLLPFDEAVADLTSAAAILGTKDALAYPYGYYDDTAVSVCRAAGIKMAFGTSGGKVYPGMDPLRLPRVRISSSQSAEAFSRVYK